MLLETSPNSKIKKSEKSVIHYQLMHQDYTLNPTLKNYVRVLNFIFLYFQKPIIWIAFFKVLYIESWYRGIGRTYGQVDEPFQIGSGYGPGVCKWHRWTSIPGKSANGIGYGWYRRSECTNMPVDRCPYTQFENMWPNVKYIIFFTL